MSKMKRVCSLLLLLSLLLALLSGCSEGPSQAESPQAPDAPATEAPEVTEGAAQPGAFVDYAAEIKLDMTSETAKQEVTVKQYIDGDTTHFFVPTSVRENGVLKARYIAINTPESTGKIEEYGKKASNFTREKLEGADSIIIESDTPNWDADSTGDRFLVWIWYKSDEDVEYRNLNIEILQEGLAIASKSSENRYGKTCMAAIEQARAMGLNVHSGQPDPDFYYGEAVELTIKELRANIASYTGMKVAFTGVVTKYNNNGIYVEQYDAEDDMYYGMYIYYGFNLSPAGLEIINAGNEVRIVGSLQYYEAGGSYQVSDLNYRPSRPNDPSNIQLISQGHEPAFVLTDPTTFNEGTIDVNVGEEIVAMPYAEMALGTSVEMKGLKVVDSYTTSKDDSASKGAMTLTCRVDGQEIDVRTVVLYDDEGNLITADKYEGKTIDVRGIVDYYNGSYQIKVFSDDDITIH